jgi:hypothetical protein
MRRSQPGSSGTDTTVRSDQPDTNYASAATLKVGTLDGYPGHGLLQFDLSSLPQSAVVTGGTLSVWVAVDNATASWTLCVNRVKQNWTESGTTWNSHLADALPKSIGFRKAMPGSGLTLNPPIEPKGTGGGKPPEG